MLQQYVAPEDKGEFEQQVRPYIDKVRMVIAFSVVLFSLRVYDQFSFKISLFEHFFSFHFLYSCSGCQSVRKYNKSSLESLKLLLVDTRRENKKFFVFVFRFRFLPFSC